MIRVHGSNCEQRTEWDLLCFDLMCTIVCVFLSRDLLRSLRRNVQTYEDNIQSICVYNRRKILIPIGSSRASSYECVRRPNPRRLRDLRRVFPRLSGVRGRAAPALLPSSRTARIFFSLLPAPSPFITVSATLFNALFTAPCTPPPPFEFREHDSG